MEGGETMRKNDNKERKLDERRQDSRIGAGTSGEILDTEMMDNNEGCNTQWGGDEREMLFLIVHSLQGSPLEGVARRLAEEAGRHGMMPYRVDYRGAKREASYEEACQMYPDVPRSALLTSLRMLQCAGGLVLGQAMSDDKGILNRIAMYDERGGGLNASIDGEEHKKQAAKVRFSSLLDRLLVGDVQHDARPGPWLQPLNSMHNRMQGDSMCRYIAMCEIGWAKGSKKGVGLPLSRRNGWMHQYTVRGHSMAAYCVVFDKRGELIITASDDRLVKIWSRNTSLLLRTCRGHVQEVSDLAVSPDNSVLASASVDGSIRLWRLGSHSDGQLGDPIATLYGHESLVSSINFSPLNSYELLSSSFDGTCRVWDIRDSSFVSMEWNWNPSVRRTGGSIPLNMNLRQTRARDQALHEGEASSGDENRRSLRPRRQHEQREYNMASAADTNQRDLVDGEDDEDEDGRKVSVAGFTRDGRHIIAGLTNRAICLWHWHPAGDIDNDIVRNTPEAKPVELLQSQHNSDVYLLQQSNTGDFIATGSRDGIVCLWKRGKGGHHRRLVPLDTWKCFAKFDAPPEEEDLTRSRRRKGPPPRVDQIAWNADDSVVLASVQNFHVMVYSVRENKVVRDLSGVHEEPVHIVLGHPIEPEIAVTASYSGDVAVWNVKTGEALKVFYSVDTRPDGRKWPDSIAYVDGYMSHDGQSVALTDAAGQLHVIGIGEPDSLSSRAPYDQFLSSDYEDLIEDEDGVVRIASSGIPAHEINPADVLCDATATPYPQEFQNAYRRGTLLSSPWRDVAWIQPGQQPGYVMAAPTLTAATWRVYASGGSENAAQQALNRAQIRLQDHERQLDMPDEPEIRHPPNGRRQNNSRSRVWETISDSDDSSEDDDFGPGNRQRQPVRQSERLAEREQESEEDDQSSEEHRERQQLERQRRAERRQMARTRGTQARNQRRSTRRTRAALDTEEFELSSEEESEEISLVQEEEPREEDEPGPSRPRARKRDRNGRVTNTPIATDPREISCYQWLLSSVRSASTYVPQKGDEVVYIRRGHEEAILATGSGNMSHRTFSRGLRAAEPCIVQAMEYFIADDDGTGIRLHLELLDSHLPSNDKVFQIDLFSPQAGHGDYVVLRSLYDYWVKQAWKMNDQCKTMFLLDNTEEWWYGRITEDKFQNFDTVQDPYEEELWERFAVAWDQESGSEELTWHSPWELRPLEEESQQNLDAAEVHPSLAERLTAAIAEVASLEQWALFQIAPDPGDAYQSQRGIVEFYNRAIPLPIGLADIAGRLENRYYRRASAIEHDIRTLADNALIFNGESSDVYTEARKLECYLISVLEGTSNAADAEVFANQAPPRIQRSELQGPSRTRQRVNPRQQQQAEDPSSSEDSSSSSSSSSSEEESSASESDAHNPDRVRSSRRMRRTAHSGAPTSTRIRLRRR